MSESVTLTKSFAALADIFCGCATKETTWGVVLAELERLERGEYKAEDNVAAHLLAYLNLSEHGTSIRGGWLTPEGKDALAFLRQHGLDWADKGSFVYDDCEYGSR